MNDAASSFRVTAHFLLFHIESRKQGGLDIHISRRYDEIPPKGRLLYSPDHGCMSMNARDTCHQLENRLQDQGPSAVGIWHILQIGKHFPSASTCLRFQYTLTLTAENSA